MTMMPIEVPDCRFRTDHYIWLWRSTKFKYDQGASNESSKREAAATAARDWQAKTSTPQTVNDEQHQSIVCGPG
jgi:hypothetical protein